MRKARSRTKRSNCKPKKIGKFKSALEHKASLLLGEDWEYEPYDVPYVMERKYKPDFVKDDVLIEVKGFFRSGDQAKYLAVRDQLEADGAEKELVFCFSNPEKKVRKGAKMSMGDWCNRHGFRYFHINDIGRVK
jgi:hypothetical protein